MFTGKLLRALAEHGGISAAKQPAVLPSGLVTWARGQPTTDGSLPMPSLELLAGHNPVSGDNS